VVEHLEEVDEFVFGGTVYTVGVFASTRCTWRIAVAELGPGTADTAAEVERAYSAFAPRFFSSLALLEGVKMLKSAMSSAVRRRFFTRQERKRLRSRRGLARRSPLTRPCNELERKPDQATGGVVSLPSRLRCHERSLGRLRRANE
jgi:hypothetical protein